MKFASIIAALAVLLATPAFAMSVMVARTGPGNMTCASFRNLGPAKRAQALAWVQGYAAARNFYAAEIATARNFYRKDRGDSDREEEDTAINLLEHWREFNKRVVRFCNDKTNPYLYRKFISDAADTALEEMQADEKFRDKASFEP